MAKVEQAAYDAGMTKTTQSPTTQLKDVAQAFYLKVWGQALKVAEVDTELELRAPYKVYYPPALRLAPNSPQPPVDLDATPTSSLAQPASIPANTLAIEKE